jgi:uncharacterized protein (UPF0212 family)
MKSCPNCGSTDLTQDGYFVRQVNEADSAWEFVELGNAHCESCGAFLEPAELLPVPNSDDCDYVTLEGGFEDCPEHLRCSGCERYRERE